MLLPTQDKKLESTLEDAMAQYIIKYGKLNDTTDCLVVSHELLTEVIFPELTKQGYRKGLPSSIEEALNSGDGVYRP